MRRQRRIQGSLERLERRVLMAASVVINEIHYDPDVKTEQVEFIELHNPGDQPFSLAGASFTNGVSYTFPAGASLPAGGYLVVTENAGEFQAKFRVAPYGQFTGSLSNEGEKVTLKNAAGATLDEVDYGAGFPWPTVGEAPGHSMELIHPSLDNDLGGSWRSGVVASSPGTSTVLFEPGAAWRYRKGTSEASSPVSAWRGRTFVEDASWSTGATPIGYDGNVAMGTLLNDMRGGYTSVFLRKTFNVADPSQVGSLRLDVSYDDGFNVWVNGNFAKSVGVPRENMAYSDTSGQGAREDPSFHPHLLPAAGLVAGTNVIAVQLFNVSRTESSDAFFDARLTAQAGGAGGGNNPSPGRINGAFAMNAAPQMRQVDHAPNQPSSGQPVTVTTKVTDPNGVASVVLRYQLVNPGDYIAKEDPRYENPGNWTAVQMLDNGTGGDAAAGDSVYTAVLPGSLQTHRRLVRYRITSSDSLGASITGPYADDEQPNFAYFVYNDVPSWTGSDRPGGAPVTYGDDVLTSLPTYHLITTRKAHEDSQHIPNSTSGGYGGDNYLWSGALVYDGEVYDHIHYRARGGVWRYAMGKNMWKFDFNRNHDFEARDAFGKKYPVEWTKLNLGSVIQQGDFRHRGEQGLFEYVGFKLFNLAGVPGSNTAPVHFRIVESASETGDPSNQYDDDFQGLYLAVEQPNGRLLDAHGLPDGNFYKMEGGFGTKNNQGATAAADSSDLSEFMNTYNSNPSDSWWRENFNLESYYNYRAIVEGIHHYDIGYGKNYFYYHNPETGKWETIPWDLDLTWADNMYGNGNEPFLSRVLSRPAFLKEYRNRLRELRDLLYNPEQVGQLIDEYADLVDRPGDANSFVDADRAMWDYNPILASGHVNGGKAGHGRFYEAAGSFRGMAQKMKDYVVQRGNLIDRDLIGAAEESAAPRRGTVSYTGPANFPADQLRFSTSGFVPGAPISPEPVGAFAAMQWRIADITPVAPGRPRYEINSAWQSGEIASFSSAVTIPSTAVVPGRTYRVRVRFKDTNGRWGHWSDVARGATEFTVGGGSTAVRDALRITEINYNPTGAGLGTGFNNDDFEFLELKNISQGTISLQNVRFTGGLQFTFPGMDLPAGGKVVVVNNLTAFRHRYGSSPTIRVAGSYAASGTNLDNAGEPLTLLDASNQQILSFSYDDDGVGWHPTTDGGGYSLTIDDPLTPPAALGNGANWHASRTWGGTPGYDESETTGPAVVSAAFDHTGAPPRLRLRFDRDVSASLQAADLTVRALPGGQTTFITLHAYDPASHTATFLLAPGGRAPNGDYAATLSGAGVSDASGAGLPSDFVLPFYVLHGDVNRDRRVDATDFALLAGNFGKSGMPYDKGDLNADGRIDAVDFSILAGNFGIALPSPPPVAPAAAPVSAAPVTAAPAAVTTVAAAPVATAPTAVRRGATAAPPARRRVAPPTPPRAASKQRRQIVEPRGS